jgi:hypothetical protein
VEISTERANQKVTSTEMSVEKLNVKEISAIPVLFGEKDIFKTLQLLPGIKSISEGGTGLYVRGGGVDQNLILLDEATVYNPSHLLGFFSIFNSDAIKDVTVYKGGIPAQYGGRISSAIDIKMNDGNTKKINFTGGIGLISSRLTIDGPINKGKGSFLISGRRTYADLFLKLSKDSTISRTALYFYDLNLKANYQLTAKDKVFISGYFGRDVLERNGATANRNFNTNWGNGTGTLRWNHLFTDKLFSNTSLVFSNYAYNVELGSGATQFRITSGIQDFTLKQDFEYFYNTKHTFKFGANLINHTFIPGEVTTGIATTNAARLNRTVERKHGYEGGLYVSDEINYSDKWKFNAGLRLSGFAATGPGTIYKYNDAGDVIDSSVYKNQTIFKTYGGLEPRLSATYILSESASLKASYNHIYQYIHLLSNTTSETPVDIWVPANDVIKPQIGDQYALGYFKNLQNNHYETSVEVYYKTMDNLIDYKNGANLILNKTVESQLLFGKGWAYGSEFFIKKKNGKLTGWISYTLSRSIRQFDGINGGASFSAKQDIIHDISIVGIYKFNDKWTVSSTFVYHTGQAVTYPSGKYYLNSEVVSLYTERNGYRFPAYHRMDVGVTYTRPKRKYYESSWDFSIYNLYGHENAYSISFQPDPQNPQKSQAVQLSLFRVVPSLTYNFKF